jgi:dTDP-glucose 4,6-dehydratase
MRFLVTGGAGFIGSNFLIQYVSSRPSDDFLCIDKVSYASNLGSLAEISNLPNFQFRRVDLVDSTLTQELIQEFQPDVIVHFAAESHVDRSISGPAEFIQSNIIGTFNLLQAARSVNLHRFHHVSTDEVYGSLGEEGFFVETTPYDPSSPYSASKAASDHLVRAYHRTYGLPVTITNCSNNYGPRQFPEKLIPLMILNCLEGKPLPVYGQGLNTRDWLYVDDHNRAIMAVIERGRLGETYNIGGNAEMKNIDVVHQVCKTVENQTGKSGLTSLITYVSDRPGHDWRYAIDASKLRNELGWEPSESFATGIEKTVRWYLDHPEWINDIRSGDYQKWIDANYGERVKV